MKEIKIGVIGTGNMGKNHVRVYDSMPEFELVGVYDANQETAKQMAEQYGVQAFQTPEDLFEQVEAVSIAAPSSLHHDLTIRAAQAGCHVLVEKPIALNVEDAQEMIDACEKNHVVLMVGHVERYNPAVIELMKVLESEKLIALDFKRMSPYDPRISDANVVQDLMIHDIDVLNAIVKDPIEKLASQGAKVFSNKLDHVQAMIRYESGILASITASRVTESKVREIQINTESAYIVVKFIERSIEIMRKTNFNLDVGHSMSYRQENIVERVFVPLSEPLRNEFAHFAQCIREGVQPQTDGRMSLKALQLCEMISEGAF